MSAAQIVALLAWCEVGLLALGIVALLWIFVLLLRELLHHD
jgi:hypothetical protein